MTDRAEAPTRAASSTAGAFASVTTLFFAWGFITSLIDPLVAAVKGIFALSNLEAQLTAFAFFIAYGVVSIPAALLVARMRAVPSIVLAIALMILACAVILGASNLATYAGVLLGLFILASGVTILQVAANPLAAALGAPERSHFRLTFSQAFNSLGTVLGPLLGAKLLLERVEVPEGQAISAADRSAALASIDLSFLIVGALLALLAAFIWRSRRRIASAAPAASGEAPGFVGTLKQVLASPWALLGGAAIFLYVGAEVAIGTQMALFLSDDGIWGIPLQHAGYYVSLYWLGAMIGRFAGSVLLTRIPAARLLAIFAAVNALLCLFIFLSSGPVAGYAALSIGLFNSIMFPLIFTLTLERSSASVEATSGFLCTAIIGGALLPLVAGSIADAQGYSASFLVPLTCYVMLACFAFAAGASRARTRLSGTTASAH
ncbi:MULTISPECIES: sugar MFS transporter [unclassified Sphingopyxis]|uniref:sugar MFS transporter n=1 Tax=unclassified Sphingopyxis TaxID=2614943 RepID=UPI0007362C8A|nr:MULTISPECIES: sugar MFS transporter [unclassified Sphingopyxis]KTE39775.1 MFS transporter [Sphingopyxis sp. HIX]KTE84866.1 MFS transporter [Sphingopyxis sp. HXXIV]